jgi:ribosome-associated toxin RatA of RatAB toxin-antitoxin module
MKKLKETELDILIDASKKKTWDVLVNQFGNVNIFHPGTDSSHSVSGVEGEVGCERQCDFDSSTSVKEKLTAVRGTESYDVEVSGFKMFDQMKVTWSLNEMSENKTNVHVLVKFRTKPAFMGSLIKGKISKMIFKVMIGLKYFLETGEEVTKVNFKEINKWFKNEEKLELIEAHDFKI